MPGAGAGSPKEALRGSPRVPLQALKNARLCSSRGKASLESCDACRSRTASSRKRRGGTMPSSGWTPVVIGQAPLCHCDPNGALTPPAAAWRKQAAWTTRAGAPPLQCEDLAPAYRCHPRRAGPISLPSPLAVLPPAARGRYNAPVWLRAPSRHTGTLTCPELGGPSGRMRTLTVASASPASLGALEIAKRRRR